MNNDLKRASRGISFALFNCLMFIVLTLIAMNYYPGGTYQDFYTVGYSFWSNFFSDLGRVNTFLGDPNTISSILFVIALLLVGLSFFSFSIYMPLLFDTIGKSRKLINIGSIFGFIAGISYIGVAFTPWDFYLGAHMIFVYAAFTSFLVVVVFYSIGILSENEYPNLYAVVFLVFAFVLAAYIVLVTVGPSSEDQMGLAIQAAGQKIIVYLAIIIMSIQSIGALRYIKKITI